MNDPVVVEILGKNKCNLLFLYIFLSISPLFKLVSECSFLINLALYNMIIVGSVSLM